MDPSMELKVHPKEGFLYDPYIFEKEYTRLPDIRGLGLPLLQDKLQSINQKFFDYLN